MRERERKEGDMTRLNNYQAVKGGGIEGEEVDSMMGGEKKKTDRDGRAGSPH